MLKSVVMHDIPIDYIAAMERWYWREHAPEINRRFGPWLARHESYLPVDAPADARRYGFFNWRVTEGYWRELPLTGSRGNLAFTPPPVWPRAAIGFFEAQPTDDLCGGSSLPNDRPVLRWYCMTRNPTGVDAREVDDWYAGVHTRELAKLGVPYRAFSTRRLAGPPPPLPGEWPASARPPADRLLLAFDRLTELWFEDFGQWRQFVGERAPTLTRPPWTATENYPYLKPGVDFVSSFLLERPTDEFSRDSRGYL
jgi:Chalcone isomerase N-terminal domain